MMTQLNFISKNALGCNADLVIVLGLSNDDWDLSMPNFPWLDFEN